MRTFIEKLMATAGRKRSAPTRSKWSGHAILVASVLGAAGIAGPAAGQDLTARLTTMTGVWTSR